MVTMISAPQRVLINTIATYGRTLLGVVLGLFSSRWILLALGEIDYGLMGVVGGLFGVVAILSGVSATSCSRYFALAVGKGDSNELNRWFNVAICIHVVLPVILFLIGVPLGFYVIDSVLIIPDVRLFAAKVVFFLSAILSLITMISSPYTGMMVAKQNIAEMSLWNILGTVLNFVGAYVLLFYQGDRWLFYAIFTSSVSILVTIAQSYRCVHLFPECKFRFERLWDFQKVKSIFSFASWQLLASIGGICRGVAMGMLINRYFPPQRYSSANASYAIGMSVYNHSQVLSNALCGAIAPELTATEGRGDRALLIQNATRASKFAIFLLLLVCIPLMLEIKTILYLWLGDPPAEAWVFSLFWIGVAIVDNMTYGQMACVFAVGKIALYQSVVSGLSMSALPLAWLCYHLGGGLSSAGFCIFITYSLAMLARVILCRFLTGYPICLWLRHVCVPVLFVMGLSLFTGLLSIFLCPLSPFLRLIVTAISSCGVFTIGAWIFLFDETEKAFLLKFVAKILKCKKKDS